MALWAMRLALERKECQQGLDDLDFRRIMVDRWHSPPESAKALPVVTI